MRTARTISVALVAALALAAPELAFACPMCMAGQGGGTTRAFAIGSIFLSVLPLAAAGAMVWYLRRRARALRDAELELERRPVRPTS